MRIIIFITLLSSLSLGSNIGLEMKIELDKNEYLLLEPILLKYAIENKSDLAIIHPEIKYMAKDEQGNEHLLGPNMQVTKSRISSPVIEANSKKEGKYTISGYSLPAGSYKIYILLDGDKQQQAIKYGYGYFDKYNSKNSLVLLAREESNYVEIKIKEPEGIDKEVYEKYLKFENCFMHEFFKKDSQDRYLYYKKCNKEQEMIRNATSPKNDLYWELLEKYPESKYAEILLMENYFLCVLDNNCPDKVNAENSYKACKSLMKREKTYFNTNPEDKASKEDKFKREREINVFEKVIKKNENLSYRNLLIYRLADFLSSYGDYQKAKEYYEDLSRLEPKTNLEIRIKEESKAFLKCLEEEKIK